MATKQLTQSVNSVKPHIVQVRPSLYEGAMSPDQMTQRLQEAFPGAHVSVTDLTGGEDHYEVFVQSSLFAGLSRIEQHQKVMAAFQAELKTGEVHALSIKTKV